MRYTGRYEVRRRRRVDRRATRTTRGVAPAGRPVVRHREHTGAGRPAVPGDAEVGLPVEASLDPRRCRGTGLHRAERAALQARPRTAGEADRPAGGRPGRARLGRRPGLDRRACQGTPRPDVPRHLQRLWRHPADAPARVSPRRHRRTGRPNATRTRSSPGGRRRGRKSRRPGRPSAAGSALRMRPATTGDRRSGAPGADAAVPRSSRCPGAGPVACRWRA